MILHILKDRRSGCTTGRERTPRHRINIYITQKFILGGDTTNRAEAGRLKIDTDLLNKAKRIIYLPIEVHIHIKSRNMQLICLF